MNPPRWQNHPTRSQISVAPVGLNAAVRATGHVPSGATLLASSTALVSYAFALPLLVGFPIAGTSTGLVLLALAVYAGVRLAYEIHRGASRWFVLTFFAFVYVFFGIAPLLQLSADHLPWAVDTSADTLFAAAALSAVGVFAFDAGLWLGSGKRHPSTPPQSPYGLPGYMILRRGRVLGLLAGISILSIALFVSRGGVQYVLASRDEMHGALCVSDLGGGLAECGLVEAFVRVPPALLALTVLSFSSFRERSIPWAALALALVGLFLTANPVSAPRFWFGAVAIGLLGVMIGRARRLRLCAWLLIPALLILVFPNLDFGRYAGQSLDLSPRLDALVEKQDFDPYQQVANGVAYVDSYGHRDGLQSLSAALFFVPRSVWPDKAPATGTLVTAALGVTDNNNVSAPLWEEAYVDFGLAGVPVILCCFGLLVAKVEARVGTLGGNQTASTAMVPLVAGYGFFLLRGSLLSVIGHLAFILALMSLSVLVGRPVAPDGSSHLEPLKIGRRVP